MFRRFIIEPIQTAFNMACKCRPYSAEHSHLLVYCLSAKPLAGPLKQAIFAFVNRHVLSLSVVDPKTDRFVYRAFSFMDYLFLNDTESWKTEREQIETIRDQPFDCESLPLIRFYLFKIQGDWYFVVCAHHICCDARSAVLLIDELASLYAKEVNPEIIRRQNACFYALALSQDLRKKQIFSSKWYWLRAFNELKTKNVGIVPESDT